MDSLTLAYLAGAMDADGCFSIRKSGQRKRNRGDCQSIIYFPRILFGQVEPTVCEMLRDAFGGIISIQKPGTRNSKPMFKYQCANSQAGEACRVLMPYLRLKGDRAAVLIELQEWRKNLEVRRPSYWWLNENPDWQSGELLTSDETMSILGYSHPTCISQALANGLLVALPYRHNRWAPAPRRFPKGLVDFLFSLRGREDGKHVRYRLPPQYQERCEVFYQKIRQMNSLGIDGTCVNHRTGHFEQTE